MWRRGGLVCLSSLLSCADIMAWLHPELFLSCSNWGRDFLILPSALKGPVAAAIPPHFRLNSLDQPREQYASDALSVVSPRHYRSSRPHRLQFPPDHSVCPQTPQMPPKSSAKTAKSKQKPQTEEREESLQAVVSAWCWPCKESYS